ncbi:Ldh family oxidoreductase [Diaphorobacter caeni]|uniref:Ldh family oxidoreductase n=1 Tax=Diaphorobacter caeni TaxID=2784387 RepID=UPI00188E4642|nr:Ldh family oxidoreductase [Diaphorobacter caeni]MBF5003894.1 Ldh family oxidoreductase [Diaphorobacter caeni]
MNERPPHPMVTSAALERFAHALLQAGGMSDANAHQVAQALVWADMRGTGSHGVSRIPLYLQWLASGQMKGDASPRVVSQLPALVMVDGQHGPGAPGMNVTLDAVTDGASRAGACIGLLRSTTHTGALGYFTSRIADRNMLGIAMAASGPHMAYHGAAVAGVSTAPLSIACPGASAQMPIVFDMASSAMALGKLMQAKATGATLPPDAAMDATGQMTTDPSAATTLLPLGGPKGSGLALMAEVVSSLLVDNPLLSVALQTPPEQRIHEQNAVLIAIDIVQIVPLSRFREEAQALAQAMKTLPAARKDAPILLPGERGHAHANRAASGGIRLSPPTMQALEKLAERFKLTAPWA